MIKDHCPLCKSKNLIFIDPFESRKKLKELLNSNNVNLLPDNVKSMIDTLNLDGEISEEEKRFYEIHGRKVMCTNCSMTFYEYDDETALEEKNAHPVSREEYIEHLKDMTDDKDFIDFVISKLEFIQEYYIESLDMLIVEYEDAFGKNKTLVN